MSHIIQINSELVGLIADNLSPEDRIALANSCKRLKNLQGVILSPPQKLLKEIGARRIEMDSKNMYEKSGVAILAVSSLLLVLWNLCLLERNQDADRGRPLLCIVGGIMVYISSNVFMAMVDRRQELRVAKIDAMKETLRMLKLQEPERIRRGLLSSSVTISIQEEKTSDVVASAGHRQSYGSL